jgi:sporulation protein YlmC with PRC-barrel domain
MIMIHRAPAAAFALALACALPAASFAAEPAAEPQMHTGYTNRSPRTPTVSPKGDQISASDVIGADVRDSNGTATAKIADLIVNRKDGSVVLAVLQPTGGMSFKNGRTTVAWRSLRFDAKPTPHFVTALSREALAAGSPIEQQAKNNDDFYDVKNGLLGKTAIGADGSDVGHVKDLVLTFGSGHLAALVIDTGGFISIGEKNHAIAWGKANPRGGKGSSPLHLALSKAEVDAAPVTATMAPAPMPAQSGNTATVIRHDSTGNISGSKIPTPADRRKP